MSVHLLRALACGGALSLCLSNGESHASDPGELAVVKELLDAHPAGVSAKTNNGDTPLALSCVYAASSASRMCRSALLVVLC